MPGRKLKEEHKRYIVRCFARFLTCSEVVEALKSQYGIEITTPGASWYNPHTVAGSDLAPELKALFDDERARYLAEIDRVPIANEAVRLERLEALYQKDAKRGATANAAAHLEQAARERGGMFTNKRFVEVKTREQLAALLGVALDELPDDATVS